MTDRSGSIATWNGRMCDVVRLQNIIRASNEHRVCYVIRVHGVEQWKALRLVDAEDLVFVVSKHRKTDG